MRPSAFFTTGLLKSVALLAKSMATCGSSAMIMVCSMCRLGVQPSLPTMDMGVMPAALRALQASTSSSNVVGTAMLFCVNMSLWYHSRGVKYWSAPGCTQYSFPFLSGAMP
jgi:hypothetical protein